MYGIVVLGPALGATGFEVPPQEMPIGAHADNGGRLEVILQQLHPNEGTVDLLLNLVEPPFIIDSLVGPDAKPIAERSPTGQSQTIAQKYTNAHVDLLLQNPGELITSSSF